jgi:hypothetical protein
MQGHCTCGEIAYRLAEPPLVVHCCHCTWCQRETGSAFALNALIETRHIRRLSGRPAEWLVPSASGKGQTMVGCPTCGCTLWSHYSGAGRGFAFVRAGTLVDAASIAPDVHIYTSTAHPWITFPEGAQVFPEYYRRSTTWRPEALARRDAELERLAQEQQQQQ